MKTIISKLFHIIPKFRRFFYKKWNRLWFWINGIQYGRNMMAYNKIYIKGNGKIIIGDDFTFTSGDSINPICRNLRGSFYTVDEGVIEIGNNVGISSACIWAKEKITIKDNANIGGNCLIMDNDAHPHDYRQRRISFLREVGHDVYMKTIPSAPILIEEDAWIGANCQILKGVTIGARCIIAAGSVVVNSIPADCIAGGNPCRVIKQI